jgi:thioredoxin 1
MPKNACRFPKQIRVAPASAVERKIKSGKPVVVKFFAHGCGYCKEAAPEINKTACGLGERVEVVGVNIDEGTGLADKHKVDSLPTLAVFKGGKLVKKLEGSEKASTYTKDIRKALKK